MAKKTRKPNLSQETLERARRELERSGGNIVAEPVINNSIQSQHKTSAALPQKPQQDIQQELRTEYAYVTADLQQMALLAAGIMGVLVVLSFFI